MGFPIHRLRRLRKNEGLRKLVRETRLSVNQLVYPMFVRRGHKIHKEIPSMPGIYQQSIDQILKEMEEIEKLSIPAVLLFGIPETKDEKGRGAYAAHGIVQKALKSIKKEFPHILLITDVCLCSYTTHGHCGIIKQARGSRLEARTTIVENDETLDVLQKVALSHAESGADMVAPSTMMDGMVKAIRNALDENSFSEIPIMSYASKMASHFYGPFRDAAESPPQFGDRKSYQMDYSNPDEALREARLDVEEGADIVMVKPALAYLDIIKSIKDALHIPMAAYHVSGEYSMVKAAAQKGWLSEEEIVLEILTASCRSGADILITYWAKQAAKWFQ